MSETLSAITSSPASSSSKRIYGEPYRPSIVKEIDRIKGALPRLHRGGAVLRAGDRRARRARLLAARRRRPASCASRTRRRCSFPTGAATTASTACATSCSDPRVALLFLIPGCGETIRVIGRAAISIDPELAQSFVVNGKTPRACSSSRSIASTSSARRRSCARSCGTPRDHGRSQEPAERRQDPGRNHRRQARRRSPRPRRAGADQGDALLNVGRCNAARSSDRVESSPVHPHAASRSRICAGTGAHDADRRLVLVERHHDLARMQMQRRARRCAARCRRCCRRRSASPWRRNARAADGCGRSAARAPAR